MQKKKVVVSFLTNIYSWRKGNIFLKRLKIPKRSKNHTILKKPKHQYSSAACSPIKKTSKQKNLKRIKSATQKSLFPRLKGIISSSVYFWLPFSLPCTHKKSFIWNWHHTCDCSNTACVVYRDHWNCCSISSQERGLGWMQLKTASPPQGNTALWVGVGRTQYKRKYKWRSCVQ